MEAFELDDLSKARAEVGRAYLEFLRVPALSMGLYELPAGGVDPQQPHTEDEVYYVLSGQGDLTLDGVRSTVGPGTAILTRTGSSHSIRPIGNMDLVLIITYPSRV